MHNVQIGVDGEWLWVIRQCQHSIRAHRTSYSTIIETYYASILYCTVLEL